MAGAVASGCLSPTETGSWGPETQPGYGRLFALSFTADAEHAMAAPVAAVR